MHCEAIKSKSFLFLFAFVLKKKILVFLFQNKVFFFLVVSFDGIHHCKVLFLPVLEAKSLRRINYEA